MPRRNIDVPGRSWSRDLAAHFRDLPMELMVVAGRQAVAELERQRARPERSFVPVMLGDEADVRFLIECGSCSTPAARTLRSAASLDVEAWMQRRSTDPCWSFDVERGRWPRNVRPRAALGAHRELLTGTPKAQVAIARLPLNRPWEVAAWLRYGGWMECPPPAVHTALWRRWHERYGAEVAAIAGDTVELLVERPPRRRGAALALAREQHLYAPDLVLQATGDLATLAALLLEARVWYFWWD